LSRRRVTAFRYRGKVRQLRPRRLDQEALRDPTATSCAPMSSATSFGGREVLQLAQRGGVLRQDGGDAAGDLVRDQRQSAPALVETLDERCRIVRQRAPSGMRDRARRRRSARSSQPACRAACTAISS
jgi:hypothetical protein